MLITVGVSICRKNAVGALKAATKEYKKKRRMRASRFSKKKVHTVLLGLLDSTTTEIIYSM